MRLRVATYNVNNLFERANLMQLDGFSDQASNVLTDVQRLNTLLASVHYDAATKAEIKDLLERYQLHRDGGNPWFGVNQIRKKLFSKNTDGSGVTIQAAGRASWFGWVDVLRGPVPEASTDNTARALAAVNADLQCLVEVESRTTLKHFNQQILGALTTPFPHAMVIDGNDDRGIDVGVLSRWPIRSVRSHVDDHDDVGTIFSRDCPEYEIALPGGKLISLLCNHFKSKAYGTGAGNNQKRARQARRVHEILARFDLAVDLVAVAGDLNDTPDSHTLAQLLQTPGLHDVLDSQLLSGPRWTYQDGRDQIDYLLVSTALMDRLAAVGIERRGIFRQDGDHFPEVTGKVNQASDHAAVWADFDIP